MQFYTPTGDDIPEMKEFLKKEFHPDEPVCKNSRVVLDGTGSWMDRKMTDFIDQATVTGSLVLSKSFESNCKSYNDEVLNAYQPNPCYIDQLQIL